MKIHIYLSFLLSVFTFNTILSQSHEKIGNAPLLELQSPESIGITFFNRLIETEDFNYSRQFFVYIGNGVAAGDINNDGLIDLFFTGMQVPNKLYLNKGNWKFEDISKKAGISDSASLSFGSTFVDIDGDGDLDLYICRFNDPNLLYINNGNGIFTEKGAEYGLNFEGKSVQAVFFDYDHDGDLDAYIGQNGYTAGGYAQVHGYADKLMINNNGIFSDISKQAGIDDDRYCLSVALGDLNNDGWTDIYVANDFEARDLLYINNKNGTFTDIAPQKLRHTSHFSMGSDIGDINNDGLADILTVDMLPPDHERRLTQITTPSTFNPYFDSTSLTRNCLQLNCGNLNFCDIGYLAGIAETDWSWASWFADMDNDGMQDICIMNGINRDGQDMDIASYSVKKKTDKFMWLINSLPKTRLRNYVFRNKGNLQFEDISNEWGLTQKLSTNGAIYADFDNDGDLDMALNNIDSNAFLYRNMAVEQKRGNFLRIQLRGAAKNSAGIGAKIEVHYTVKGKDFIAYREAHSGRGFLSCVDPIIHVGLADATEIKKVIVYWPGSLKQIVNSVPINKLITIKQADAKYAAMIDSKPLLCTELSASESIDYKHKENVFDDFYQQRLMPGRLSINGPAIAAADINGDAIDDLIIGGSHEIPAMCYIGNASGKFTILNQPAFEADFRYEDQGILLFDADGDGDNDCYISSGGNELAQEEVDLLQDRLYINDGKGLFAKAQGIMEIPGEQSAASCTVGADYDSDGDIDIFIGARAIPGKYPFIPKSILLRKDINGWKDITDSIAPGLSSIGLVTSALWSDVDNDNDMDLWIVGEWMSPTLFINNKGKLSISHPIKDSISGAYNSIISADIDNDGDMDYVCGNVGKNTRYKPTIEKPIELYVKDFDENGSNDVIMTYWNGGKRYPVRMRAPLYAQIPTLNRRFPNYHSYGQASFEDIFGASITDALHFTAHNYSTIWLENKGAGQFIVHELPIEMQFSPIYGLIAEDFNADGAMDIMAIGNFNGPDPEMFRYDNGLGCVLLGNGKGDFTYLPSLQSGFIVPKDGRSLIMIPVGKQNIHIIAGINSGKAQSFTIDIPNKGSVQKNKTRKSITIKLKNGKRQKREFPLGSGYYSQSPAFYILPQGATVEN